MYDTLDNLWLTIDAEMTNENRADMLHVLADFHEENDKFHAAQLLRMLVAPGQSDLTDPLTKLCEVTSAANLLKRMQEPAARLFACTCAEQILLGEETVLLESIQTTRQHLFRLKSDQLLNRTRELAWNEWSHSNTRESRNRAWVIVRACRAVHRGGNTDENVFVDALYAWLKVRVLDTEVKVRESLGMLSTENPLRSWTWREQLQTAAEYLLLGRMVVESQSIKKVREEYRDQIRRQYHSKTPA